MRLSSHLRRYNKSQMTSSKKSIAPFVKRHSGRQLSLITDDCPWEGMPNTRYQGSKRKLLPHLHQIFAQHKVRTALDAFGGTGSVSYLLSRMGVDITYNDILPANCEIARALISHGPVRLEKCHLEALFEKKQGVNYHNYISDLFQGIYFLDQENEQLDIAAQNISRIEDEIMRAEAYYLIFQSMLCKRPYNLFHRANLGMRTKDVKRGFGNKATWDRPFIEHMKKFLVELANARTFQRSSNVRIHNESAFEVRGNWDLVYIDTPYAKSTGQQESNYFNFYHFLDAVRDYASIPKLIQRDLKHRPFYPFNRSWFPGESIDTALEELFGKFSDSSLVISYRSDGYPAPERIEELLRANYRNVSNIVAVDYKYVLSTRKVETKEIVIVANEPKRIAAPKLANGIRGG